MSPLPEPFLVIDRAMRGLISLPSEADAVAFLDIEEKLWSWTEGVQTGVNSVNNTINKYRPSNWVQRFRNSLSQNKNDFQQSMRQRYGSDQCLCNVDLAAQSIRALSDPDKWVAAVALTTLHGDAPITDQNFFRDLRNRVGVAHGNTLLAGVDPSTTRGANHELNEARNANELESQRMRALIDLTKQNADKNAREILAAAQTLGDAQETTFQKAESERAESFSKLNAELEATLKAFEVRMELQAPVAYWKKRANQYLTASRWSLGILIMFACMAIYVLYHLYDAAAAHLPTDASSIPYAALFRASTFALLMTSIFFWIGRVMLRIYLSARHLATDAEERRTMITTFLALTRKSALQDEDRKFILAPLFRPGSDGIVNEDAAPDTMFAALLGSVLKK